MKKITWLTATIAMSLTVGYGARLLNGENTTPVVAAADPIESAVFASADGEPLMLPALTVVVKVPAKRHDTTVLASSTETWTHPEIAVVMKVPSREEPIVATWTHPEIAVVVKVPAKTDGALAMGEAAVRRVPARFRHLQDGRPEVNPAERPWWADRDLIERLRERNEMPEIPAAIRGRRGAPAGQSGSGTEGALRPADWDRAGREA